MLPAKCSLFDIEDVEAFVIMCIKRSGVHPDPREYEDLVAEGIVILWDMSCKYKPRMNGHLQDGRFSGYAIKYMPRKMKEAYHCSHEHHLRKTENGKRRWEYRQAALSWDELINDYQDNHSIDETTIRGITEFIEVPQQGLDPAAHH